MISNKDNVIDHFDRQTNHFFPGGISTKKFFCITKLHVVQNRPVAEGGGGGGTAPQLEILKSCPTKTKFVLVDFSYFYRRSSSTNDPAWFTLKWQALFQEKTINQDIHICRNSYVNTCMANRVFVVAKFAYS